MHRKVNNAPQLTDAQCERIAEELTAPKTEAHLEAMSRTRKGRPIPPQATYLVIYENGSASQTIGQKATADAIGTIAGNRPNPGMVSHWTNKRQAVELHPRWGIQSITRIENGGRS